MKIIHTADWHLGRIFYEQHLTDDQSYILQQFLSLVAEEQPDAVVIAGDLYDRAVPPAEAVRLLDRTLQSLMEIEIPVIAISGNHDSTQRVDFGSRMMAKAGIFICGEAQVDQAPIVLKDEWGEVYLCPFAFATPESARLIFGDEEIRSYEDVFRAQAKMFREKIPAGSRAVAIAHAFVAGGIESESERPLSVGGSTQVDWQVFADFQYTMLGHLHRPQSVGRPDIRYSGSLLKYSFDECAHHKGIDIVTIAQDGTSTCRSVHLQPLREMRIVEGTLAELLEEPAVTEDYLLVKLTDTRPQVDAMGRLRSKYPHILALEYPAMQWVEEDRQIADLRKISKEDLFAEFIKYMRGEALTDEEETLMQHVWNEALKEEEV